MRKLLGKRGFTLIELLVVIAIIGILAAVVLVSLNSARGKARNAQRQSDIVNISLALEMYYDDQDPPAYPATLASLAAQYFPSGIPTDPTGTAYTYTPAGTPLSSYTACATLEDSSTFCKP